MGGDKDGRLLSICCLGYCHASYLSDAIKSICAIDYDRIEVLVVDDGSSDNSVAMLEALSAAVPFKMTVIAQNNTGNIGLNFNNAYRLASGGLVAFISLDDVYNPAVMLKQIEMMNADSDLAFVASSKTVSIDDDGYVTTKAAQLPLYDQECNDVDGLLELEYAEFGSFYIQSAIFRKAVIDAVGAFDEDMTGDDIVLRTKIFRYLQSNSNYRFEILKENSFFYRLHGSNVHRNFFRQIRIVTEYLERYWPERENPKILIDWTCSYVSDNRFDDCVALFSMNRRTASLISDERIKSRLRVSIKNEVGFLRRLQRLIYNRVKLGGGKRKITLLGFWVFEYTRVKKTSVSTRVDGSVHYTAYK
ncbi:glycosyltransferase family 2 protein [Phytopseudomonas daroniae]|uniref:glycosyltransferase family 2 protein n=1 Tax=Phytopseudomonas daroniae TaxID=2487519 RepID=UPI0010385941|nr:glycosyltransferase [Pseudomonas daroniae]TBU79081.1 hypothetical protein DNK10_04935 [Pseudomonas daroniae]